MPPKPDPQSTRPTRPTIPTRPRARAAPPIPGANDTSAQDTTKEKKPTPGPSGKGKEKAEATPKTTKPNGAVPNSLAQAQKKAPPAVRQSRLSDPPPVNEKPALRVSIPSSIESAIDDRDVQIGRLQEEVEFLKLRLSGMTLVEDEEKIDALKQQIEQLKTELANKERAISEHKAELESLRQTAETELKLEAQLKKAREDFDMRLASYKRQSHSMITTLEQQVEEMTEAAGKAEEHKKKAADLERKLLDAQVAASSTAKRVRALEMEVEQAESYITQIAALERQLTDAQAAAKSSTPLENQLADAQAAARSSSQRIAELEAGAKSSARRIAELEAGAKIKAALYPVNPGEQTELGNVALEIEAAHEGLTAQLEIQISELNSQLVVAVEDNRHKDEYIKRQAEDLNYAEIRIEQLEQKLASATENIAHHLGGLSYTNSVASSLPTVIEPTPTVEINITIDPADRKNWSLLRRAKAALKKPKLNVTGPEDLVTEFTTKMQELEVDHEDRIQQVLHLQKRLIKQEMDMERLEQQADCIVPEHRKLEEKVAGLTTQLGLQDELLRGQGMRLRRFEEERRERERVAEEAAASAETADEERQTDPAVGVSERAELGMKEDGAVP